MWGSTRVRKYGTGKLQVVSQSERLQSFKAAQSCCTMYLDNWCLELRESWVGGGEGESKCKCKCKWWLWLKVMYKDDANLTGRRVGMAIRRSYRRQGGFKERRAARAVFVTVEMEARYRYQRRRSYSLRCKCLKKHNNQT